MRINKVPLLGASLLASIVLAYETVQLHILWIERDRTLPLGKDEFIRVPDGGSVQILNRMGQWSSDTFEAHRLRTGMVRVINYNPARIRESADVLMNWCKNVIISRVGIV